MEHTPIEAAETWITSSGADIRFGFDHAYYSPAGDRIEVPGLVQYDAPLDHYSTVCHELTHWTSHATRLNRQLGKRFGDNAYAAPSTGCISGQPNTKWAAWLEQRIAQ